MIFSRSATSISIPPSRGRLVHLILGSRLMPSTHSYALLSEATLSLLSTIYSDHRIHIPCPILKYHPRRYPKCAQKPTPKPNTPCSIHPSIAVAVHYRPWGSEDADHRTVRNEISFLRSTSRLLGGACGTTFGCFWRYGMAEVVLSCLCYRTYTLQ